MSKKLLNENEICDQFITPAIIAAGWDKHVQVRREYTFTAGQVIVRGKVAVRGKKKRADYLLFHTPNLPLVVVEAKDNRHPVGGGMQQALAYAEALDVPFVVTSNGDGFMFHDRTGLSTRVEQFLAMNGGRGILLSDSYGAKPGLNLSQLRSLPVPLPPPTERNRIVAKVDALMAMCDDLEARLIAARDLHAQFAAAAVHHLDV
jgi:hypothetical protein